MKTAMTLYAALIVALGCAAAVAQERSLFNGKDLAGWDGAPGWWRVEDGAITGESTAEKPCKKCNYLIWKGGQPADFELTVDFRISKNANSGIHFRSQALPDWDASGYQADMTGDGGLVGVIYYHKGGIHEFLARRGERATFAPVGAPKVHSALGKFEPAGERRVETLGDPKTLLKGFKVGDWNTYRIVCRGPEIRLYLNGVLVSQATDQYPPRAVSRGVIGFQMHPGHGPTKIQFKNIILKELKQPAPEKAADLPSAGHSAASTQPARKWEAAACSINSPPARTTACCGTRSPA